MRFRLALVVVFFICTCMMMHAQDEESSYNVEFNRKHLLDVSFEMDFPMNYYRMKMDDAGFGGKAGHLVQLVPESPMFIGYSISLRQFQLRSVKFEEEIDLELVEFKEFLGLNYLQCSGLLRYYLPLPWYWSQIYIQGEFGYLASYSLYSLKDIELDETSDLKLENWDGTMTYRMGGGLNIPLHSNVYIKLEIGYQYSNSHTFLSADFPQKKVFSQVQDYFTEKKGPFEALNTEIGVTFAF